MALNEDAISHYIRCKNARVNWWVILLSDENGKKYQKNRKELRVCLVTFKSSR